MAKGTTRRRSSSSGTASISTRFDEPADAEAICGGSSGCPAGTPLVVVVSRLARLKGLEQLLEAAAILKPRNPDARFLIVGETARASSPISTS